MPTVAASPESVHRVLWGLRARYPHWVNWASVRGAPWLVPDHEVPSALRQLQERGVVEVRGELARAFQANPKAKQPGLF